jgi:hypothetical protein
VTIKREKSETFLSDRGFYLQMYRNDHSANRVIGYMGWITEWFCLLLIACRMVCLKPKKESGKRIEDRKKTTIILSSPIFFLIRTHMRLVLGVFVGSACSLLPKSFWVISVKAMGYWSCCMQVMTTGQKVSFEYHGNNYIFTVNQAAVEGQQSSNAPERGMISSDTYFVFETSNGSGIKVVFLSFISIICLILAMFNN